jgi:hypothetical protein
MDELRYTLLGEGPSDRALLHLIHWLLRQHAARLALQAAWADLRRAPARPRGLAEKIGLGVQLYPCDLLFVHRDADHEPRTKRVQEIHLAVSEVSKRLSVPPFVCVVPVRMLEAWLLFDEEALRAASGNPNGRVALNLPQLHQLESLTDPKTTLGTLFREASGLSGHRRKRVRVSPERVAALTDDYAPLRALTAFRAFEDEVQQICQARGWSR